MGLKEAAGAVMLIVVLGLGVAKLLKKGLVREYIVYASVVLWTGYLLASQSYNWIVVSPVTIMSAAIKPLGLWLKYTGILT
jgi:predicted DNA-binding transcriptional regulator